MSILNNKCVFSILNLKFPFICQKDKLDRSFTKSRQLIQACMTLFLIHSSRTLEWTKGEQFIKQPIDTCGWRMIPNKYQCGLKLNLFTIFSKTI